MISLDKAIQRAFDSANLEGDSSDIWNHMFKYAAIRNLSRTEQDAIYEQIAKGLGF